MKELKRYGLDSFDCIVPMSDGGLYMRDEADARIAELTAEVARYKADAERGDWIIRHASWMRYDDFTAMYVELPMDVHLHNYALRQDAIDSARNALKGQA